MKPAPVRIDLQNESDAPDIPAIELFQRWVEVSLRQSHRNLEQCIRVVDEAESRELNHAYRGIDKPTNVLSFPADRDDRLDYDYLGDLVICAPVVEREARAQQKSLRAHWAHMVVHGMLHLQGYDHIDETDARKMEAIEIEILASLGHTNPYDSQV